MAILGSAKLDVSKIDIASIKFGGLSVLANSENNAWRNKEVSGDQPCSIRDINRDGFHDMVCQFQGDTSKLGSGNVTLDLTGSLQNGMDFEGHDSICFRAPSKD